MTTSKAITETIELEAWADLIRATPAEVRTRLGLDVIQIGEASALVCEAGGILMNRVLGARPHREHLAELVDVYRARGIARYFVHLYEGEQPAVKTSAEHAGLGRYPRAWVKLLRGSARPERIVTDLTVTSATEADGPAAGRIYADAFDLPAGFAASVAALIGRPHWDVVVAREGDVIAAVGLLFEHDGVGYLAGGATQPAYRQRGAQGALMAERVRRAVDAGCLWVATETGEAAPGDPQHSYRNMLRCGFEVVGRRDNFAPAGMVWAHGRPAG